MAEINVETIGFVDRRRGRRGTRLDRKDRRLREVAPTKIMLAHEVAGRYSWAAWVVILVSLIS